MACERSLDALADVGAGAEAPHELEAHLAACEACRAHLSGLQQALARVDGELAGLLGAEPSPALLARIRAAVEADASPRFAWRCWGSAVWLAAAATLLLGVALAAFLTGRPVSGPGRRLAETDLTPSAAVRPSTPERPERGSPVTVPSPEASSLAAGAQPRRLASASRSVAGVQPFMPRRTETPPAEVLVPADAAAALLRLSAVLVEGEVAAGELMTASTASSAPLAEPALIDIRPLEIAPLEPYGSSGT